MPIVEFECRKCGKRSEHLHGMTGGKDEHHCVHCGHRRTRRVISRCAFQIPAWMTDEGIAMNARQREWLATPEAKAMDLRVDRSDSPAGTMEPEFTPSGPTADEVMYKAARIATEEGREQYLNDVENGVA